MTETFRVGILGAGEQADESRGPRLQDLALTENVVIAAVADPDGARADAFAQKFGVSRIYASLDDMLATTELDGLVNTTPHAFHASTTIRALEAGLHVLCEKPMATTAAEAQQMLDVARGRGLQLAIGYQLPFMVERLRSLLQSGLLGELQHIRAEWLRRDGIPDRPSFYTDPDQGVGADLLSHLIAAVLSLTPAVPQEVAATSSNSHGVARHGELFRAEDTVEAMVMFDSGVDATLRAAWVAAIPERERIRIEFEGTRGTLRIPLPAYEVNARGFEASVRWRDPLEGGVVLTDTVVTSPLPVPTEECFLAQNRNWIRAARGDEPLRHGPELALTVQRILERARESARSGTSLTL